MKGEVLRFLFKYFIWSSILISGLNFLNDPAEFIKQIKKLNFNIPLPMFPPTDTSNYAKEIKEREEWSKVSREKNLKYLNKVAEENKIALNQKMKEIMAQEEINRKERLKFLESIQEQARQKD